MQQLKSMNRAAKRHQKKLARKVAKNRRGHPPHALGQGLGGTLANKISELVRKGAQLHQAGQVQKAETIYRQVLDINPNHADVNDLLGSLLIQVGNHAQAVELISRAIAMAPDQPMYHSNLGIALKKLGRIEEAAASYRKALTIQPDFAEAHNNLGNVFRDLGRQDDAVASYHKALAKKPDYAMAHKNLGNVFRDLGRLEEAVASYRAALAIEPDFAMVHRNMAIINKHSKYDDDIKAMEELYARPGISDNQRLHLAFGLGKAFEDLQRYEKAFDFFLEGNTIKQRTQGHPIEEQEIFFNELGEVFDSALFAKYQSAGCKDETPIFILGMPRSGTTLVEHILASHPHVHGAGEIGTLRQVASNHFTGGAALAESIRRCDATEFERMGIEYIAAIRKYSKQARFVTNKMPSNFQYIGLIKLILPNAKVIHCRRNPRDNCMSIFKCFFASRNHAYAYDLSELGRYYNRYRDLMTHWRSVLPGFLYNVQYEDMVANQVEQTRGLLEHCDLEWDDACLEFFKSDRPVKTASAEQVRRPIYKDSVQSWKRYEKQLAPLLEILG